LEGIFLGDVGKTTFENPPLQEGYIAGLFFLLVEQYADSLGLPVMLQELTQ
jgi:hypothetical protein